MFCPVCLSYAQQVEAITVVNGTQFCAAHGVEALEMTSTRSQGPMRRPGGLPFTPPVLVPPAAQPPQQPTAE